MTIIHVDTVCAAAQENAANELSLPVSPPGFFASGSSSPWSAWAVIAIFGDTNDANEGRWLEDESGGTERWDDWLTDTSETGKWLIRLSNAIEFGGIGTDLPEYYNAGKWSNGLSNWKALGSSWGYGNISVDTQVTFSAGWSYGQSGEYLDGVLEFAKGATGLINNFEFSQVNLGGDTIGITGHGLSQGDAVLFKLASGTAPSPLLNNYVYYVIEVDANTIKLGNNMIDVDLTENPINLTTTGTSTTMSLTRIEADGTAQIQLDADD